MLRKGNGTEEFVFTSDKVLTVTNIPAIVEVARVVAAPAIPGQVVNIPAPLPQCGNFTCPPSSTVAKSARLRCSSSTCSVGDCCALLPKCATHQCPINKKGKDASTACKGMICTDDDCCTPRAPCVPGTSFNAQTAYAPCNTCTGPSTCALGVEQACDNMTDTRCVSSLLEMRHLCYMMV
jgi:hypothetical protein